MKPPNVELAYFDELPIGQRDCVSRLSKAVARRSAAEIAVTNAVIAARGRGVTWEWIGACLQVTTQAAWSRYQGIVQVEALDGRKETSAGPE